MLNSTQAPYLNRFILIISLLSFFSFNYSKNIYIHPSPTCTNDCDGTDAKPYNNLWTALEANKDETEPLNAYLLYIPNKPHIFPPRSVVAGSLTMKPDLIIQTQTCLEAGGNANLNTICSNNQDERAIILLKRSDMKIDLEGQLQFKDVDIDGRDDILKFNADPET